ncbi:MAG: hypothetical protein IT423_08370 [Pirellulaceae bacterium]|nr:hypothetical protein [Pirellulaceae bacterium]
MRTFRSLVALATIFTLGMSTSQVALSQGPDKPVAVVSIAPLDRLLQDFTYLMKSCGAASIGAMGKMFTQQVTNGLDGKRPAGVTIAIVEGQPVPLLFLPLDDRSKFFKALEGSGQFAEDLGSGKFAFDVGGRTIYAKDAGKWLYVSQSEDDFKSLPADPATLLGDTPNKYDIAVRVQLQALPAQMRDAAIEQMKQGFERSLAVQDGQSPEEKAAAEEMGKASIKQMERLLNETEQVLIGLNAASTSQKLQIDVGAQFISGSELASQMDKLQGMTSDFTGLLIQGAAMTLRSTSLISDGDKALAKSNLSNVTGQLEKQIDDSGSLPAANKDSLKKFIKGMIAVLEKTIDSGKFDGGGAVALNDGKVRAVFGGSVADGMEIEKEVKELVASLGTGPEVPKFEFNYGKHQNVNLHKVSIPIKTDDPKVEKVFGSELKLVIGTGAKAFFVSLDPDGDAVIKSALDRLASTKNIKVTPGEMIVEVGQVLAFVQTVSPNPLVESAATLMQQTEGKDKIRVLNNLIPRGMLYQVIVEEGVLKGIGAAVQAGQGGGPGF